MINRTVGQLGEDKAADWLGRNGWQLLERNYRCRFGEADIIAWDGKTILMVEVKARGSSRFGLPAEAVNRKKLKRMQLVAENFRKERGPWAPVRLGVVTILGQGEPSLITEIETID